MAATTKIEGATRYGIINEPCGAISRGTEDYYVTMGVNGRPVEVSNDFVREIFGLFAPAANWKFPVNKTVTAADVFEVLLDYDILPYNNFPSADIFGLIASCITFHVGGQTAVYTRLGSCMIEGEFAGEKITAKNAGYYANIGA